MGLSPYGPDLEPNDFFLFPSVNNKIGGQRLSTTLDAVDALKMHVFNTSIGQEELL